MSSLSDIAMILDPGLIMARAGMEPDTWQAAQLRARPQRLLLNCSRQSGKSTVTAAMALHEALYYPPALVLLLSPTQRQSAELFRVVMKIHARLGSPMPPEVESTLQAEMPNGSRIIALPGKEATIRGFAAVSLLIIDEASRVADDLYNAVQPMLAVSGGRMLVLSTPWGKRGFFFREWSEGEGWQRVRITADQCSRIPPEFLQEQKRRLNEAFFLQEYYCEFADAEGAMFSYDDVMGALSPDVEPLFPMQSIVSADVRPLFQ